MVIKMDVSVDHVSGLGESVRFAAIDALRFQDGEKVFSHRVIIAISAS